MGQSQQHRRRSQLYAGCCVVRCTIYSSAVLCRTALCYVMLRCAVNNFICKAVSTAYCTNGADEIAGSSTILTYRTVRMQQVEQRSKAAKRTRCHFVQQGLLFFHLVLGGREHIGGSSVGKATGSCCYDVLCNILQLVHYLYSTNTVDYSLTVRICSVLLSFVRMY